jgi:cell division protein FtsN
MARQDSGIYEPNDEVRVFDGAEDEDDDEGSRLPLVIVGALLVLAMFGGLVWLAYSEGVARGRTETPVLAAAPGPARVAPAQPGGADVQYQGFKIYEQPAPPDEEAEAKAVPPPPVPASVPPSVVAKSSSVAAPPVLAPTPKVALTPPPPMKKSVQVETPASVPAGAATAPPRQLPGAAAAPKAVSAPSPAAASLTKPATKGTYVLQIGAYKSQEDADTAWKTYKAKHAALLSGYGPDVQKADLGDKGIWYRLRVAGFSDQSVASALCDRLKADGGSVCFLGK